MGLYWNGLVRVIKNHFEGNGDWSIYLTGAGGGSCLNYNTIESGDTEAANKGELYLNNISGLQIASNYFEGATGKYGIYGDGFLKGLSFKNNIISTNKSDITTYGISLVGSTNSEFVAIKTEGNYFYNFDYAVNIDCTTGPGIHNSEFGYDYFSVGGPLYHYIFTGTRRNVIIKDSIATIWQPLTDYQTTIDDYVTNDGGKVYKCITTGTSAASGGPTGYSADITDGTAHWSYVSMQEDGYQILGSVRQNSMTEYTTDADEVFERAGARTFADSADDDTGMGTSGWFMFSASTNDYTLGVITSGGTVTLIHNTANISTTKDNAATFNLYLDATSSTLHIQNKTGGARAYMFKSFNLGY